MIVVAARTSSAEGDADGITLLRMVPKDTSGFQSGRSGWSVSSVATTWCWMASSWNGSAVIEVVDGRDILNRILNAGRSPAPLPERSGVARSAWT
jgi:alkylation response protein AidB-like acyl-CoA dehydrogenase